MECQQRVLFAERFLPRPQTLVQRSLARRLDARREDLEDFAFDLADSGKASARELIEAGRIRP